LTQPNGKVLYTIL